MVAFNTVLNLPELSLEQAELWTTALLAQERALRQYDSYLTPASNDQDGLQAAEDVHEAWRRWVAEGVSLLRRVAMQLPPGTHVAGTHDLDYGIARATAMLKLSPHVIQQRVRQLADGCVLKSGEVRNALRVADGR